MIIRDAMQRYRAENASNDGAHGAWESEMRAQGMETRVEVEIGSQTSVAAARVLGLPASAVMVVRRRKMYAQLPGCGEGGPPSQEADTWLPADIAQGTVLSERDTGPGGIKARMAELGHEQVRFTEELETSTGIIHHVGFNKAGRPVEYTLIRQVSMFGRYDRLRYSWEA